MELCTTVWLYVGRRACSAMSLKPILKTPRSCGICNPCINILLVGDPSLAKSELLKECSKISNKSMYTSGRGASAAGTSTTTGDGGMTKEERGQSKNLVYQLLPSRYGMNPDDLRKADAIEVVIGQGAKPGGGGMLLGQKISDRVAEMRDLPKGIDQRSACRHPDWTGPDDHK